MMFYRCVPPSDIRARKKSSMKFTPQNHELNYQTSLHKKSYTTLNKLYTFVSGHVYS